MNTPIKLRRSFHYVPGSYPQLLDNASKVPADVLCFDCIHYPVRRTRYRMPVFENSYTGYT